MVVATTEILTKSNSSIFNKTYRIQILATITVHILTFSHGIGLGWLSPSLYILQSSDTPLSFSVSIEEASWIGSLFGLGSLAGNIFFCILMEKLGRKWSIYILAIPHMLLWILIYFAQSVEYLYCARFFGGMAGGGTYVVISIYISEIANPSIRGALSTMRMLFLSFGVLLGFVLSSNLDYYLIPCIAVVLPIIYLIGAYRFPETPQYLLKNGKFLEAEDSYKVYNNVKEDLMASTETQKTTCAAFEEFKENILKSGGTEETRLTIQDFLTRPALKAFRTALFLILLNQFSGAFAFVNYMSNIFALSGSTIDPNTSTIAMGVVQITGTWISTVLVDRFGRKPLILCSSGGMAVGMIVFGLFTQFISESDLQRFNWMPLVLMGFVTLCCSLGVNSLFIVIVVEVLPSKIRSTATSVCMASMSCMMFVALKVYPILLYSFGLSITMYSCAGVCIIGWIYLVVFLEETNGKSMDHD